MFANTLTIILGIIVGVFTAFVLLQFNLISSGNVIIIIVLLSIIGIAVGIIINLKRALNKHLYEIDILRATDKSKNKFISIILHFIRTPLSGIRWSLRDLLDSYDLEIFTKKELEKLYDVNNEALISIEHLLNASRMSLERIGYDFKFIKISDVQELIKNTAERFAIQAKKKGLGFDVKYSKCSDYNLYIDKEKIINVVQSMLQNAINYTSAGFILLTMEENGRDFVILISDTGIGISEKDNKKIFSQFFRGYNAITKIPGGFGIGLYLSKIFIERHGGKIWFKSEENNGTTFFISLPIVIGKLEEELRAFS